MNTNYKTILIEAWKRKGLFRAFQEFDDPCYNISAELEIAPLYKFAKAENISFFLLTCYAISKAMNSVPEMRQRFLDPNSIREYEVVHPATPIMIDGGRLFAQTTLPYAETFAEFREIANPIIKSVQSGGNTALTADGENIFCASCMPWFSANAISCAIYRKNQDTNLISWFKMTPAGTTTVSGRFNHSFVDGFHIGQFFNAVAENFQHPETL